jgi:hypothetical protein
VRYPATFKTGRIYLRLLVLRLPPLTRTAVYQVPALAAWILALLLVAGTFAAGRTQAQDRPPAGDRSTMWRA